MRKDQERTTTNDGERTYETVEELVDLLEESEGWNKEEKDGIYQSKKEALIYLGGFFAAGTVLVLCIIKIFWMVCT